ncbi:nucleotidyltransferase family protein [Kitasatospora sp. CMC57]|uniref:Nucleotidyltransferase family protein n=1 Tax=Kitasatospora sp. CMC57 TaxID=3231513 RepID=A0AB33KC25_9ACTN
MPRPAGETQETSPKGGPREPRRLPPAPGEPAAGQDATDPGQDVLEATKQVAHLLKAQDRSFALAGGVAAYAHGVPRRSPHDTDFCVLREDVDAITETLTSAGLRVWRPPEDWLVKAEYHGCTIDLIFSLSDRPVGKEMLERAEMMPIDSVWMPVLSATDLIGSQLRALSEHHCDYGALLPIARTLRERVDWAEVRRQADGRPMAVAFLYLLELLDVIRPTGEDAPR